MRQRRLAILVLLPFLIAGCPWSSDAPELLDLPDGLSVEAFEGHTLELSEEGRLEIVIEDAAIAIGAVSIHTSGVRSSVSLEVASLSGQPASLPPPTGEATYQFIEIGVDKLDHESIESVTFAFSVKRAWLDSRGYGERDIALQRFTDTWELLPTELIGQIGEDVRYEAVSPGLSLFAITVGASLPTTPTPSPTPTPPTTPKITPSPRNGRAQPNSEPDSIRHAYSCAVPYAHTYSHSDPHPHKHANAYPNCYAHAHPHSDPHPHKHANG